MNHNPKQSRTKDAKQAQSHLVVDCLKYPKSWRFSATHESYLHPQGTLEDEVIT